MQRLLLLLVVFTRLIVAHAQPIDLHATGPQPFVVNEAGQKISLYEGSYALLISQRNYIGPSRNGWRQLDATTREMDLVADALRKHGFAVRRATDLSSADLTTTFREFMADYGHRPNNRLLFFFSGHGYTNPQNDMGYIVPIDALDPNINPARFFSRALPIESIQTWARELAARHVLFLFDSCFSGSIFMSKGTPLQPDIRGDAPSERFAFFRGSSARPVRQFISAGGPKEELPATSIFIPLFIEAINGQAARTNDGYVTGKEIGLWLEQTVPRYRAEQNPHSGVIRQPDLSFGDMVFQRPQLTDVPKAPVERPVIAAAPSKIVVSTPVAPVLPTLVKVVHAADVFFDLDKSLVRPDQKPKLDDLVVKAQEVSLELIIAVGHTEDSGSDAYAQKLSVRLAESVKSYLVSRGIEKNRVYTEGKGKMEPIASNATPEGRAKNRRVEIELVGTRPKS